MLELLSQAFKNGKDVAGLGRGHVVHVVGLVGVDAGALLVVLGDVERVVEDLPI